MQRISQLAERYAPSNVWYIQTMTTVFELGGDLVQEEVANNLMRLIAEGSGEDDELDEQLRVGAVETLLNLLDKPVLPDVLVKVMSWVLGEYSYLSKAMTTSEILERLCELAERQFHDLSTRGYVLTAITKCVAQTGGQMTEAVSMIMDKYSTSNSTDLQQRSLVFKALLKNGLFMQDCHPLDASCEDFEVDPSLPFLSQFVDNALANGMSPYSPPQDDDLEHEIAMMKQKKQELRFEAYEAPVVNKIMHVPQIVPEMQQTAVDMPQAGFNTRNVKNVWGAPKPEPVASPKVILCIYLYESIRNKIRQDKINKARQDETRQEDKT